MLFRYLEADLEVSVNRELLEEFAEVGFPWFRTSGIGLDVIAEWCNEQTLSTGDQRYWILAASFAALDDWWASHDRVGGIATHMYLALNESVTNNLRQVLDEPDPAQGAFLAGQLSLRIQAVMDGRIPVTMYDHEHDDIDW
jgi:hypothetical protein